MSVIHSASSRRPVYAKGFAGVEALGRRSFSEGGTPGPITPIANWYESWSTIRSYDKDRWLWVPAFAGTTMEGADACLFALDLVRQFDHHAPAFEIDRRHHGVGERQQHRRAVRRCDLDDVAGAEIMDRDNPAERFIRRGDRGEP